MDNTMFAYLFGAFLLGFLVSWIAGRSGPKRALEDCQATANSFSASSMTVTAPSPRQRRRWPNSRPTSLG
jgi:hypothetical protein